MGTDRTVGFESDDNEMNAAVDTAKRTFRQFLNAFLEPKDGQYAFLLKGVLTDGERVEHAWVADLELVGEGFRGVIANEPALAGLRFKQPVEFEPGRITYWMFIDGGKLVGGYTTRLIRQRMTTEERAAFDAAVLYSF